LDWNQTGGPRLILGVRDLHVDTVTPVEPSAETKLDLSTDFEAFYRCELDWARRLAFLLTSDAGCAEDMAHDAFLRLEGRFRTLDNPRAYLRVTIVNLCRRYQRGEARRVSAFRSTTEAGDIATPSLEILDVVDRLPRRQRAVVVLRYFDDLSEREIAKVLGCRPGTVKSLAARALQRLRKELDHE
jgi:RNA polymerase sigma factor (sigma-70 family)